MVVLRLRAWRSGGGPAPLEHRAGAEPERRARLRAGNAVGGEAMALLPGRQRLLGGGAEVAVDRDAERSEARPRRPAAWPRVRGGDRRCGANHRRCARMRRGCRSALVRAGLSTAATSGLALPSAARPCLPPEIVEAIAVAEPPPISSSAAIEMPRAGDSKVGSWASWRRRERAARRARAPGRTGRGGLGPGRRPGEAPRRASRRRGGRASARASAARRRGSERSLCKCVCLSVGSPRLRGELTGSRFRATHGLLPAGFAPAARCR